MADPDVNGEGQPLLLKHIPGQLIQTCAQILTKCQINLSRPVVLSANTKPAQKLLTM